MTGLKPVAVNAASHGMNSPSSIITNHIYGCSMSMSLKIGSDVSNGTVLVKSNSHNPTMKRRKGFKADWPKNIAIEKDHHYSLSSSCSMVMISSG